MSDEKQNTVNVKPELPIACIYHGDDLDGKCAGAIVNAYYSSLHKDVRLISADYNMHISPSSFNGYLVYIVDFSFPMPVMAEICKYAEKVVWIDHHKTARDAYLEASRAGMFHGVAFCPILLLGIGACCTTWLHFHTEPVPRGVNSLGLYDVWAHDQDETALYFHHGLDSLHTAVDTPNGMQTWKRVFWDPDFYDEVVERGTIIVDYTEQRNFRIASKCAQEIVFEGHSVLAVNGHGNSEVLESLFDFEKYDFMMVYHRLSDGRWKYSLYSGKGNIHLGEIAKRYGGGGHKDAAGFILDKLII